MSWLQLPRLNGTATRRAKAAMLLGLFLSILGLATSASLHQAIHPTAGSADHHCAATMLASGQVDAASSSVSVAVIHLTPIFSSQPEISFPAVPSFNLSLSRGPPALLS